MADQEAGKKIKDDLMEKQALASFNKSVISYLKDNLQTEGEERVADKIRFHLGVYSNSEDIEWRKYEKKKFSFAIKYNGEHCDVVDADQEELQNVRWWKNILGMKNDDLIWKKWEVGNSIDNGWVGKVVLFLAGEIESEKVLLREKLLLDTMVDILHEVLDDIQGIEDIGRLLEKRKTQSYTSLIEAYVAKVFKNYEKLAMLKEKDCIRLSHEKYERRETSAKIYIGQSVEVPLGRREQDGGIIYWMSDGNQQKEWGVSKEERDKIEKGKIRYYRKMMELCKNNKYLVTCFGKNGEVEIGAAADQKWLDQNGYKVYIDFKCNGEWYLTDGDEEVLCYIKGMYYYSKAGMVCSHEIQLQKEVELEEEMRKKFSCIIERMREQEHGAGMIITENAEEIAKELCIEYNRGTVLIEALDLTNKENQEFLLGITSVDGMLLMDKTGRCHAFGVILDGKASLKANPARGSRYNSAVNYIYDKEGSCAVIVSEDKTVDIVGKSIREDNKRQ